MSSNYGSEFDEARSRALDRDGYECFFCGMHREEHLEEYDCDLHAHHVIPKRDGGPDTADNLVMLCQRCHSRMETVHARAVGEMYPPEEVERTLQGATEVLEDWMDDWDEAEQELAGFLDNHPTFRDEFGFFDEGGSLGPSILSKRFASNKFRSPSSEWAALVLLGYKEGIADVVSDLDGKTDAPHDLETRNHEC